MESLFNNHQTPFQREKIRALDAMLKAQLETENSKYRVRANKAITRDNTNLSTGATMKKVPPGGALSNGSLLRTTKDMSVRDRALSGDTTMSRLASGLQTQVRLDSYLLDQKLKNNNTYNRLKSSVSFQSEFLAHMRLNKLT